MYEFNVQIWSTVNAHYADIAEYAYAGNGQEAINKVMGAYGLSAVSGATAYPPFSVREYPDLYRQLYFSARSYRR
jgi:hypothetical protein